MADLDTSSLARKVQGQKIVSDDTNRRRISADKLDTHTAVAIWSSFASQTPSRSATGSQMIASVVPHPRVTLHFTPIAVLTNYQRSMFNDIVG
jgi:hypothetical protein